MFGHLWTTFNEVEKKFNYIETYIYIQESHNIQYNYPPSTVYQIRELR